MARYRLPILAGVSVLGLVVVGFFLFRSETRAAYECETFLEAPATATELGFPTDDLGRQHIRDTRQTLEYRFCPPTSGPHFESPNGPIRSGFYPASNERHPGGWVHNLEHGYVVALYRCPSSDDCPTEAELEELRRFAADVPPSAVSPQCGSKLVVARFDAMTTQFAVLAWGRALLTDDFDQETATAFYQRWVDHEGVPERGVC